jgi:hypothetical protein
MRKQYYNIIDIQALLRKAMSHRRLTILAGAMLSCATVMAQTGNVHGTVSDEMGPLMGATVVEIDASGRIINSTVSDLNGNFSMAVKNPKNRIQFSFVGMKKQTLPLDRSEYKIMLKTENEIKEVTVTARRRTTGKQLEHS